MYMQIAVLVYIQFDRPDVPIASEILWGGPNVGLEICKFRVSLYGRLLLIVHKCIDGGSFTLRCMKVTTSIPLKLSSPCKRARLF